MLFLSVGLAGDVQANALGADARPPVEAQALQALEAVIADTGDREPVEGHQIGPRVHLGEAAAHGGSVGPVGRKRKPMLAPGISLFGRIDDGQKFFKIRDAAPQYGSDYRSTKVEMPDNV